MEQNLYSPREARTYVDLQMGGGLFSKFEWLPDGYGQYLDNKRTESQISK